MKQLAAARETKSKRPSAIDGVAPSGTGVTG